MIPLKDLNPTTRPAVVTALLVCACLGTYLLVQRPAGQVQVETPAGVVTLPRQLDLALGWAAVPCELASGDPLSFDEIEATFNAGDSDACRSDDSPELYPRKQLYLAVFVSMFLHGGLAHLAGNMLFLWIFANNIEDRLGRIRFLAFYLAGGLVATAAHVIAGPNSTVPVVGASGAIAAVMGAYLVLYPKAPVLTFIPPLFLVPISARWFLGAWFVLQFFTNRSSGVAWVAHVGGFVFGLMTGLLVRTKTPEPDDVRTLRVGDS